MLLGGRENSLGAVVGKLFEAAWDLFEYFDFDPMAVEREVRKTFGSKKGIQGR